METTTDHRPQTMQEGGRRPPTTDDGPRDSIGNGQWAIGKRQETKDKRQETKEGRQRTTDVESQIN